MAVELASSWCAMDLGAYRPCRSTYERYPLDSVPPVRDALDGFQWLGDRGRPSAANVEGLARLEMSLTAVGVTLGRFHPAWPDTWRSAFQRRFSARGQDHQDELTGQRASLHSTAM